jgi:beta-1,4-N-acetylglucosaminyltransferase
LVRDGTGRIGLVGSSGGHLDHLIALEGWWGQRDRFWVTFAKVDARSRLRGERVYWSHFPTNRHVINLFRNTLQAIRVLARERPEMIVTSGAGAAIPYIVFGRWFGCKTVFLEVFDRVDSPTVTGRIAYRLADLFIVQWEEQLRFYPRAVLVGPIL